MALAQSSVTESLSQGLATFARNVPTFLLFLVILIVGYFVAKAISRVLDRVLERVGFDRAVERGGLRTALQRSNYDASDVLSRIVFYGLFLFVLQIAFSVFGPNPISGLITGVIAFLPKLFVAIVIIVIAAAIGAAIREIVQVSLGGLSYGRALANVASTAILVIGIFAALSQLGIAETITNTLFIGLVAIIAGSAIIAIGGGGVQPMRGVWERALDRVEEEAPRIREEAAGSQEQIRERARERAGQASDTTRDQGDDADYETGSRRAGRTIELDEDAEERPRRR